MSEDSCLQYWKRRRTLPYITEYDRYTHSLDLGKVHVKFFAERLLFTLADHVSD